MRHPQLETPSPVIVNLNKVNCHLLVWLHTKASEQALDTKETRDYFKQLLMALQEYQSEELPLFYLQLAGHITDEQLLCFYQSTTLPRRIAHSDFDSIINGMAMAKVVQMLNDTSPSYSYITDEYIDELCHGMDELLVELDALFDIFEHRLRGYYHFDDSTTTPTFVLDSQNIDGYYHQSDATYKHATNHQDFESNLKELGEQNSFHWK